MFLGWNAPIDGPLPASEEWTDCATVQPGPQLRDCQQELTAQLDLHLRNCSRGPLWSAVKLLTSRPNLKKASGAGDGPRSSRPAGEEDADWKCLVTSVATQLTNWSNRAGGKAGSGAITAGEDGPERRTDDWGAGSLSLQLECEL